MGEGGVGVMPQDDRVGIKGHSASRQGDAGKRGGIHKVIADVRPDFTPTQPSSIKGEG
jgi:hypothetical protein